MLAVKTAVRSFFSIKLTSWADEPFHTKFKHTVDCWPFLLLKAQYMKKIPWSGRLLKSNLPLKKPFIHPYQKTCLHFCTVLILKWWFLNASTKQLCVQNCHSYVALCNFFKCLGFYLSSFVQVLIWSSVCMTENTALLVKDWSNVIMSWNTVGLHPNNQQSWFSSELPTVCIEGVVTLKNKQRCLH